MGKTYRGGTRRTPHTPPPPPKTKNLAAVNIVALNRLHPGTWVLAQIPFDDDDTRHKTRPAIVRAVHGRNVTLHPCYTRRRHDSIEITRVQRTSFVSPVPVTVDRLCIVDILDDTVPPAVMTLLGLP